LRRIRKKTIIECVDIWSANDFHSVTRVDPPTRDHVIGLTFWGVHKHDAVLGVTQKLKSTLYSEWLGLRFHAAGLDSMPSSCLSHAQGTLLSFGPSGIVFMSPEAAARYVAARDI
jgi:hypothetical protein